jgi:glycosyltransferase 2 family protein
VSPLLGASRPRIARRRTLLALAVSAVLAAGVVALIGRAAGFTRVLDGMRQAAPQWLAVCFVAEALSYAGYVVAFRAFLRGTGGPTLGGWLSARVVFASLGGTRLSPAGAGGLAVIYWALRRLGFGTRESAVRVLGLNTLVYAVFGLGAWFAALAVTLRGDVSTALTATWLAVVGFCVAAAALLTAPARVERLARVEGPWWRRGIGTAIAGTALVRTFLRRPDAMNGSTAAVAYWLGDGLCLWAGLRAFGIELPPDELALAYATGYAATILPLPLSGAGGVDAAMTYALVAVGVPLAPALLGVIAYRTFSFWLPIIPGVVALALAPGTGRSLERARFVESPA